MIININQNKIENINKCKYNTSFGGITSAAIRRSPAVKDVFIKSGENLHLDIPDNKKIFDTIKTKFEKLPKEEILGVYTAIIDSSGNVSKIAYKLLEEICDVPKQTFVQKIFHKKNKVDTPYTRYGLKFVANILEKSKDKNQDHIQSNIDFAKSVYEKHSTSHPESYYNLIKISKNTDGVISKEKNNLYCALAKEKAEHHYKELTDKNGYIDSYLVQYVSNFMQKHKIDSNLFDIIKFVSKFASDSQFILDEVAKRTKTSLSDLKFCVEHSKSDKEEISLSNFNKLADVAEKDSKILKYYRAFRDKSGNIRNANIRYVKSIADKIKDEKEILTYKTAVSDADGVVCEAYIDNYATFLKNHPKSNNPEIISYCLNKVKNADGTVAWDYLKSFYDIRNGVLHKSSKDDPHKIFEKSLDAVRDNNGNIDPLKANEIRWLFQEGLLGEISYLIKAATKSDGKLDKGLLGTFTNVIGKIEEKDKIDLALLINDSIDKQGNFDNTQFKVVEDIIGANIKSYIMKVYKNLLNPDGKPSKRGLDLITHLRKNGHHQIEPELPKILKMCRDNNGLLNDKNINSVKKIQSYKPHVDLSDLFQLVLTKNGEVDDNKMKSLITMLHHSKLHDQKSFKVALAIAKDKTGNIDFDVLKLFWKIRKNEGSLSGYKDLIPALKGFVKYNHVTSFDQLSLSQKRDLMRQLTRHQNNIRDTRFKKYLDIKILPQNDSDYCTTLARLSHSLGINVKPLSHTLKSEFFTAMKRMSQPHSEFMKLDFDNHPPKLILDYSVEDFQKDVWKEIKNLSYSDRIKTLDYFGFELKCKANEFEMSGFPSAQKPDGRLKAIHDKTIQHAISKVYPHVVKFSQANKVSVRNLPQLSKDLTAIIKAFPEFLTTIGKVQHHTHDYTLDVHILNVLQGVFKNPEFNKLSDYSKRQIELAALFHDINKAARIVDHRHAENSAFDTYYLLDKLELEEKNKLKIYHIIKNHSWLTWYNNAKNKLSVAKDLAYELRSGNAFKLISILTEADLKGVKKGNGFFNKHVHTLASARKSIEPMVYDLQKTAINLPQTKIPKAHKLNHKSPYVKVINQNGIKNSVIYLRNGIDLRKVGFEEHVDLKDLNMIVHGLDTKDQAAMFQALGLINSKALLSTSYINYGKGNWRVFRQQGFVLDVAAQDIQVAYWRDFGSGYKKDKDTLFSTYLWQNNPMRNYMSDALKKELHLSNSEYINLYKKIEDMSISELDVQFPKVAKAYRKIFTSMDVSKRSMGRNYNEILVNRPKIQAVFCWGQNPENLSPYLRRYAEKNDIPILVFG